jgi:hypothetical protein
MCIVSQFYNFSHPVVSDHTVQYLRNVSLLFSLKGTVLRSIDNFWLCAIVHTILKCLRFSVKSYSYLINSTLKLNYCTVEFHDSEKFVFKFLYNHLFIFTTYFRK